mmetsp:Transcript_1433/g.2882  ORF Transcript_1433/g.2882 Transcript_1433/m.2882 type:complete len:214 (-) Transcript_1433:144-785(-)
MSVQKFVILAVALLAVDAATEIDGCVDCVKDEVTLLQHTLKAASGKAASSIAKESASSSASLSDRSGTKEINLSESQSKEQHSDIWNLNFSALVPKDLKPLSMEEIRKLNASRPQSALVDMGTGDSSNQTHTPIYDFGVFCGKSTRFDVAKLQGRALTVEQCYIFSCVAPFISSSTCGPTFYTNGQGNCKCCGWDSTYYYSTADPPNYLYSCR